MTVSRRTKAFRLGVVALLLGGLTASASQSSAAEVGPYPGALPDTPSATTVTGRGEFSDLSIHVNQTSDLTTQAISVTWNWPGRQTLSGVGSYGNAYDANVLRIMQCWGDPVTSAGTNDPAAAANYVAADPGPPREQCVYGGSPINTTDQITSGNQQNRTGTSPIAGKPLVYGNETVYKPTAATSTTPSYPPDIPFVAANGTVVPHQTVPISATNPTKVYSNEFFDSFSSNELPANYTFGPDGRGGVQFQTQNSNDARGTGCGALKKDSTTEYNKCWLVVVPQGTLDYDGKTPLQTRANSGIYRDSAYGSPLASTNWSNRIVVPLNFLPSISACASQGNTYETLGSPLVNNAMLSWQSELCSTKGTVYNYAIGTDARSRDALASGTTTMQFTSQPVPQGTGSTPITYAPVTLSGLGVAFVWDKALFNTNTFDQTPGLPLPTISLNQRLVAKLLTYSYQASNIYRTSPNSADNLPTVDKYQWALKNPVWLGADPEFLDLNPQFKNLGANEELFQAKPTIATLQGPLNGSDAIARLWQWVMSDQPARDFMAGKPAPGGMTVDPYYNTDPTKNPTGIGFSTDIDGLPYADPWTGKPGNAKPKCKEQTSLAMSDIWPAARDFPAVAKDILTVNPLEKYTGSFACPGTAEVPVGGSPGWHTSRTGVVTTGQRQLAGLTDTASGAQFGVTFASLANANGKFVQPTTDAITAAASHLKDTGVPGVQQPDLATTDPAAYPLSLIAYAGVTTNGTSKDTCAADAQLLTYAGTDGQTSGTSIGQLPPGYVPLSATLRAQTLAAARTVAQCAQTPAPTDSGGSVDSGGTGSTGGGTGGSVDSGPGDTAPAADAPVDVTNPSTTVTAPRATSTPLSLSPTSRTKPDPSAFAYVVPIALGIGLLSLLAAPIPGLRRRRPGGPV